MWVVSPVWCSFSVYMYVQVNEEYLFTLPVMFHIAKHTFGALHRYIKSMQSFPYSQLYPYIIFDPSHQYGSLK